MGLLDGQSQYQYYPTSFGGAGEGDLGGYQFVTLDNIISAFLIAYVGENKLITKVSRTDVQFHAMRAVQELSYDVFRSVKSQELEVPPSLTMPLPQDYVNYTKVVRVGSDGIERVLYPTGKTSNPFAIEQNDDGSYVFYNQNPYTDGSDYTNSLNVPTDIMEQGDDTDPANAYVYNSGTGSMVDIDGDGDGDMWIGDAVNTTVNVNDDNYSDTWTNYQSESSTYTSSTNDDDADSFELDNIGRRYGLDPQYAQANGTFFIDYQRGYIHFGSSLVGETITLKYVSDGLGTDAEMVVHKFCEEACYKWIACAILSTRSNIPEYIVQRFKKEKFAETRKAKIRLSNIKIEEFTQILKGISKQIK